MPKVLETERKCLQEQRGTRDWLVQKACFGKKQRYYLQIMRFSEEAMIYYQKSEDILPEET